MVDSRTGFPPQRAGIEVSGVQMQVLELWGQGAGVLRGSFSLKDGKREGGYRGLSISGASREVAPGRPETVLEPGKNLGWVTDCRHRW